ncbi:FecR family protein [Paraflavitalea soli]|uniref:FecR family protein n=1 Tax=Paraflavitalea soli TaxID=2315862 RepID=A0A3B7MMD4_9BACT|nr:FecR family protein [Paraflavitalea soli]AXY74210.1 FecR family protein [Paraflavitalea soli]
MDNIAKRKADLITRHLKGSLNPMEQQELDDWISESDDNRHLFESLTNPEHLRSALNRYDEKRKKILNKIQASIAINNIQQSGWWFRWRRRIIGAGIAVILLAGAWICWQHMNNTSRNMAMALPRRFSNEVWPGCEQAKLTLDDRSVIILVDTINGVLATDANGRTRVFKENGWLSYYSTYAGDSLYYNTIRVPRKGQYKVILPDGSRVWLNAGSTLRYPVVFGSMDRRVELQGEAYFEVTRLPTPLAGNAAPPPGDSAAVLPFVVSLDTGNAEIRALGARFNVKAYDDDAHIHATLLEGVLQLTHGANELTLIPGQEGRLENNGQLAIYNNAHTAEAIAWKEGLFRFKDANIDQVMKQLERWYDIEVIYEDDISDLFTGTIERNTPLSQLLRYLEQLSRVQFAIIGNKVIVSR